MRNVSPTRLLVMALNDPETLKMVLNIQTNIVRGALDHMHIDLNPSQTDDVIGIFKENLGLTLHTDCIDELMALYPFARANVIQHGANDTETRDRLVDALSYMLVGVHYTYQPAFITLLCDRALEFWGAALVTVENSNV